MTSTKTKAPSYCTWHPYNEASKCKPCKATGSDPYAVRIPAAELLAMDVCPAHPYFKASECYVCKATAVR